MKIGLTGGIGSGKTTVCELFSGHGVPVIDADQLAREVVCPGQPALAEILAEFGQSMLTDEGQLDRGRLRARIFDDPQAKARLEAILHPRIRQLMHNQAEQALLNADYCILAIPLLLETGQQDAVDRVLVIDCEPDTQLQRVALRDQRSLEETRQIIASQASRSERLTAADDVILNDSDADDLKTRVDELHHFYLSLIEPD